ncbi:two component, sigma54 specific, transcriptional regulator, Fis family [Thermodesulfatator indicus DSM 15286]|uniref:Two component, sigma54 specific, transcriptional regulator, Fis family n=1 Tax=Thermodesulfatator indicus (strain DSM 15286 / JCM 11887 / CIR29812) TaxID=667014 RepID=F8A807_THEID|nr:sigma-54 dependent transcriptional regulator [Thermodesulfatator indicus]AEH45000.1 two component, sigma54 specific, transcriptional regulator, Fis family [Thermodesulfatator indicus DSM 15286]
MSKPRILIIDDDPGIRDACFHVLTRCGYEVDMAARPGEALGLLSQYEFDAVLLDLRMPDINGLDLLKQIKEIDPLTEVIIITAYGTVESAVKAMKNGACDFLEKPFNPDELKLAVEKALTRRRLALENLYLKRTLQEKEGKIAIIGESSSIKKIIQLARVVAQTDSTILITGESGTGKGLLARKIHELSPRAQGPFVAVDCGTLVPTLFESELFGHVKGAFTGATSHKVGKFELANGGTIFFDEIGNISIDIQAKLLKAVEDKEISPVGSHKVVKVDVRIVAATNKNLEEEVKKGTFRKDLFYRLNVVSFNLPPLRERIEDIPLLARYFLQKFGRKYHKNILDFEEEVLKRFSKHPWPGNVRELENTIERLVIFATNSHITLADLKLIGFEIQEDEVLAEDLPLEEVEKRYILRILKKYGGNKSKTAKVLGIDRKTLRQKLVRWGLS